MGASTSQSDKPQPIRQERPVPTDAELGLSRGWEGEIAEAASFALGPPHPELLGAGRLRGE